MEAGWTDGSAETKPASDFLRSTTSWEERLATRRGLLARRYGLRRDVVPIVSLFALTFGLLAVPLGYAVFRAAARLDGWLVRHSDEYAACAAAARRTCLEAEGRDLDTLCRTCARELAAGIDGGSIEEAVEQSPFCSPLGIGRLRGKQGDGLPAVLAGLARGMDATGVAKALPSCPSGACRLELPRPLRGTLEPKLELVFDEQGLAAARGTNGSARTKRASDFLRSRSVSTATDGQETAAVDGTTTSATGDMTSAARSTPARTSGGRRGVDGQATESASTWPSIWSIHRAIRRSELGG